MKKIFTILFLITIFASCKTSKSIQSVVGKETFTPPFKESKYLTDKETFRATNNGTSEDLSTSKRIALFNAKNELASNLKQLFQSVTDQYTNQRSVSDLKEFESKFQDQTIAVVKETLTYVSIIGEEYTTEKKDGKTYYTCWIAIEKDKKTILDGVGKKMSSDSKLQLDYDKKQFEEVFNREMEKLSKEQ